LAEEGVPCPRCGVKMEYWVEIELGENGQRRIKYYYRCPRCGYRVSDAVLVVKRVDGRIVVEREEYRQPLSSRVGAVKRARGR